MSGYADADRFAHIIFDGAEAMASDVADAVRHHGCAIVRGAIPLPVTAYLADAFELCFRLVDFRETWSKMKEPGAGVAAVIEHPLIRMDIIPTLTRPLGIEAYEVAFGMVEKTVLWPIWRMYYAGREPVTRAEMSMTRRQRPALPEAFLPFHQDGTNYVGMDFLNFWIPLMPVGRDASCVEVVTRGLHDNLALTEAPSFYPSIEVDEAAVLARFGPDALFRPVMEPGDVLIMNPYTIHRTHMPAGATKGRISVEMRIVAS